MVDATAAFDRGIYDIGGRTPGPDNPALVPGLMNLATERLLDGKLEDAAALVTRALSLSETGPAQNDPDFVVLLSDLIRSSLKQSAHSVAEPLLLRLLAIKRSKGEDHPEVATVLASLATVRQALGRHESAEQLWRRVLEIRERTLAPNHFALATALEHLGESCAARGKIGEALELFQRALNIRELTLGAGNPSLRVSRDRIADLQLQASEESLDASALQSPPPAPDRYRLSADHGVQSVSRPIQERSAQAIRVEKAVTEPRKKATPIAPLIERDIPDYVVPPSQLAVDDVIPEDFERSQPELVNYREVILSIQQELEEDEHVSPTTIDRLKNVLGSMVEALRQRQKEISVTVAAVVLVAGLTTVSWAAIKSQRAAPAQETTALPGADQTTGSPVTVTVGRPSYLVDERAKAPASASAASIPVAPSSRARVDEQRSQAKKSTDQKEQVARISIPQIPAGLMARFDSSVRARSASAIELAESFPVLPAPLTGEAKHLTFERDVPDNAAQPARLIGTLPTPRITAQLAGQEGEVLVRFDVDASGRPLLWSLSVVNSSNALLTAAVLNVIPGLRFEPARSAGPERKPVGDVMEIKFKFQPTK